MIYAGGGGPGTQAKLLRASTVLSLCLYCHDGDNAGLNAPGHKKRIPCRRPGLCPVRRKVFRQELRQLSQHARRASALRPLRGWRVGTWTNVSAIGATLNCTLCHDNHGTIIEIQGTDPDNPRTIPRLWACQVAYRRADRPPVR